MQYELLISDFRPAARVNKTHRECRLMLWVLNYTGNAKLDGE